MLQNHNTVLCIDFGNSRKKAAFFTQGRLQEILYFIAEDFGDLKLAVERLQPNGIILSSVINHPPDLEVWLAAHAQFHLLNHHSKLPFTTPVGKPETIGADRLALCAGAVLSHPHQNNLVIGLGSAVTYNFINTQNAFLGGGISPGLTMRMKALNSHTAKLPFVDAEWNVPLVGYDTKTNIQSGVVLGLAYEIDGFVEAYRLKYKAFNVHLTGGDARYLAPHLKNLIFADTDLLFKGLYAIFQTNAQ
ncbi:MAG: type III pantothenate kinase [Bacteroidetes bacterium]|nr:MAG: type III pantothenate kinase [Bacteroidota bacterium]